MPQEDGWMVLEGETCGSQLFQAFCSPPVWRSATDYTSLNLIMNAYCCMSMIWGLVCYVAIADWYNVCCCSVAKSCLTLWDPIDCSMPGFPVLHYLPEFAQTHVHWIMSISSSSTLFSFCLQSFPESGSFPMSRLFPSGGQNIGASASASVFLMNIQGWFPLGLTGLISLQSKRLSSIFSSVYVQFKKNKWKQCLYIHMLLRILLSSNNKCWEKYVLEIVLY